MLCLNVFLEKKGERKTNNVEGIYKSSDISN